MSLARSANFLKQLGLRRETLREEIEVVGAEDYRTQRWDKLVRELIV